MRIHTDQLRHREHGRLDRDQVLARPETRCVAEFLDRRAEHDLHGEPNHRHASYLREERHRAAGAGVDLEDVDVGWRSFGAFRFRSHDHVLDVH